MKKFLSIFLLLFISAIAFSQSSFNPDSLVNLKPGQIPHQLVNDFSNALTADQKQTLENKLDTFSQRTSTQIAVVVIPSLGNYEISDYSVQLGRAWGVGGKQFNNGIVLLICTDAENHKVDIATGYGLEGALPDVTCKAIIDNDIVPNFKSNDYYAGIDEGTNSIIKATQGEYTAPLGSGSHGISISKIIFLIVIVISLLSLFSGRGGGGGTFMSGRGFITPFLLGNLLGGGGNWGGGSGGSSGGGFGSFGGGSFGGGGASGSW